MSDRQFDPDWPHGHVTRDGRKARILAKDAHGENPIVAEIECGKGDWVLYTFLPDGTSFEDDSSPADLQNAPAPKRKISGWLNILIGPDLSPYGYVYETKETAVAMQKCRRVFACIPVEFEEGEGL